MLKIEEKEEIIAIRKSGNDLSEKQKAKLLEHVKSGHPNIFGDDHNELCCDLGINPPNRYVWTTFENCKAFNGSPADKSMCGR